MSTDTKAMAVDRVHSLVVVLSLSNLAILFELIHYPFNLTQRHICFALGYFANRSPNLLWI